MVFGESVLSPQSPRPRDVICEWEDLTKMWAQRNALTERMSAHVQGFALEGLGGPEMAYFVRSQTLSIGEIQIHKVVTELLGNREGIGADGEDAGNIGTGALQQFDITFDYPHHRLYFDKNANFEKPGVFNRSDLRLQIKLEGILVGSVLASSPAEEAGVSAGDMVTTIDGWSGDQITAERLFGILQQRAGTTGSSINRFGTSETCTSNSGTSFKGCQENRGYQPCA